ncbi:solute carrier family 25 member 35-like [Lampetra fluviatilis]
MDFLLGGFAASAACLVTNPLEVVKTRMQVQGELQARGTYQVHYRHAFHALVVIARSEGLRSLQKGLAPALLYQLTMNGVRLGAFALMERRIRSTGGSAAGGVQLMAAGAIAGICGATLGSPLYLVKTHLQTQSSLSIAVGHQYSYTDPVRRAVASRALPGGPGRPHGARVVTSSLAEPALMGAASMVLDYGSRRTY